MSSALPTTLRRCWALWPRRLTARGLVVGVSGGADSVALLAALTEVAREHRVPLTVAHAHHGLRGADADADAALVESLADRLGWRCVTARLDVRGEQARTTGSLEMTARRLRHAFLARTAREAGMAAVALGHHGDDQVELFLLRLFRGAGGDGLGGMAPTGPSPADAGITLLRPLLDHTREELRAHAVAGGWPFREDASNADASIPRNHVRQVVLPWLRAQAGDHLDAAIRRSSEILRAEADCVDRLAADWLGARRPRAFGRLPVAVQRAVVRRQLWDLGCPVDFDLVERLRQTESRQSADGRVVRRGPTGRLATLAPPAPHRSASHPVDLAAPGGAELDEVRVGWRVHRRHPSRVPRGKAGREHLDATAVGPRAVLRHWRPGDRFQPLGFPRPTKLQDLFTNRKVPVAERRHRLVATTEHGVLFWVEGLPPGEAFKVHPGTKARLEWTWERGPGVTRGCSGGAPAGPGASSPRRAGSSR